VFQSFDVAIAGAGPAGAAAALILARMGRSVLLVDAAPADAFRVGEGLPPSAHSLLQELNVLERFRADGHRVSHGNVSLWGSEVPQSTDFMFQAHGQGYQLDRFRFDAMMKDAARRAGVRVCDQTRLNLPNEARAVPIARLPDQPLRMQLSNRNGICDIECRWLIDAGGRAAVTARRHGVERYKTDRLIAFYTVLRTDSASDRDGRTMIEADRDGWWYSVLLPSNERLLVYLCDRDLNRSERAALLSCDGFAARLTGAPFLSQLCQAHRYRPSRAPQGADASSGRLERFCGEGWLALGDAALSFDPLSSQGISNALYTGMAGARAINAALDGHMEVLTHYNDHLARIYDVYLRNRATFYGYERRWNKQPFWRRRHAC
jgi:flavin-dependent dehydrogenase